mgnify:CR=1 FL=1
MIDVTYDLASIEKQLYNKDIDDKDFMVFKDRIMDVDNLTKEDLVIEALSFISSLVEEVKEEEDKGLDAFDEGYEEGYTDGKEDGYSRGFEDGYEEGSEIGLEE